jgi:cold shock CspA family protein
MAYFYGVAGRVSRAPGPAARPPEPCGIASVGHIAKLFVGQVHGFIRMANSRDIYFHRTDLRDGTSINDLRIGDRVAFELVEDRVSGARASRVGRWER